MQFFTIKMTNQYFSKQLNKLLWKEGQKGEQVSPKGGRRKRAARILRRKNKPTGYGPAA